MNYAPNKNSEYFCFECSLHEARRGTRLISLGGK
jgi:hypothetical protein